MIDYVQIYRSAWNATKKSHQPAYDDLVESYRNLLTQRAAGAMQGIISDGPFGAFESQVYTATRPKSQKPERVTDEPEEEVKPSEPEPIPEPEKPEPKKAAPKKTAKKLAATKTAAKKVVKVIKKAVKKGKK